MTTEWISVSERSPGDGDEVLVWNGEVMCMADFEVGDDGAALWWREPYMSDEPIHWMPLPDPPPAEAP